METVKVYQIGVGSFGRYGFEKLVEMHNHLEEVDVELRGLCDIDFEKLEAAEKFAEAHGIEIETFRSEDEMYRAASGEDGKVMVYDAGPPDEHAGNVFRSLEHGFFHLAEKPPSLNRDEHIEEKRLARERDVFWKVDFIERESPVVKKTTELLEGKGIDRIEIFRESSVGVQKVLDPVNRSGVKGGDILDKMIHEVYVLDLLEAAGHEPALELEYAHSEFLMPRAVVSDSLMTVYGGRTDSMNGDVATAMTSASFSSGEVDVVLRSSWLGASDVAEQKAGYIQERTGHQVIDSEYRGVSDQVFLDQDSRFFTVEGERNLAGDMLHNKLFDLDTGEEIEVPDLLHDQLYRVIEKAVRKAAGQQVEDIGDKEVDVFMNAVFDVRDAALQEKEFFEELERGKERMRGMILEEEKILEDQETESVPS